MNTDLMEETFKSRNDRLQKGQRIIYEGKEAEVIGLKPLLVIKTEDRIICGALHKIIESIEGRDTQY